MNCENTGNRTWKTRELLRPLFAALLAALLLFGLCGCGGQSDERASRPEGRDERDEDRDDEEDAPEEDDESDPSDDGAGGQAGAGRDETEEDPGRPDKEADPDDKTPPDEGSADEEPPAEETDPALLSTDVNPDFVSDDHVTITYETLSGAQGGPGRNQVERGELPDDETVTLIIGTGSFSTSVTRGDFLEIVTALKARLDTLGEAYAIGYFDTRGQGVAIRISPRVAGLPMYMLLTSYGGDGPLFDQYYVGDAAKTLQLSGMTDLDCRLVDGRWQITVTLDEDDAAAMADYLAGDAAGQLYFVVSGGIVFGHLLTADVTDPSVLTFSGIDCLGSAVDQADYAFLMDLMVYSFEHPVNLMYVGGVSWTMREDTASLTASDGKDNRIDNSLYGVQYVTAVDEQVFAAIQSAFPNADVYRPVNFNSLYASQLYVFLNNEVDFSRPDAEILQENLDLAQQAYTLGGFDSGAYSHITIYLGSGGYLGFEKDEGGVVRMEDVPQAYVELILASEFYRARLYPGVLAELEERGWEYDANGNLTRMVSYRLDGSVQSTEEAAYDGQGRQILYRRYQSDGQMTAWEEYSYNDQGQLAEVFFYEDDGALEQRAEVTYDADGSETYTWYDADGNVID